MLEPGTGLFEQKSDPIERLPDLRLHVGVYVLGSLAGDEQQPPSLGDDGR